MRFGNDEVKPGDMNEDASPREDRTRQVAEPAKITNENACKDERQLLYNCLNDNKSNIDACQDVMNEVKDCERNYAKYFSKQSKETERDLS